MARVAHPAQISPELVLVSPELAEQARAALPDRPWELFVTFPPPPVRLVLPEARAAPAQDPPLARAPAEASAQDPPPAPLSGSQTRPSRLASYFPGLVLVIFAVVVAIGSSPWVGDRPTLGPPPSPAATLPVATTTVPPSR